MYDICFYWVIAPVVYGFSGFHCFLRPLFWENVLSTYTSWRVALLAISLATIESWWIILTSRDLTPKGSLVQSSSFFQTYIEVARVWWVYTWIDTVYHKIMKSYPRQVHGYVPLSAGLSLSSKVMVAKMTPEACLFLGGIGNKWNEVGKFLRDWGIGYVLLCIFHASWGFDFPWELPIISENA